MEVDKTNNDRNLVEEYVLLDLDACGVNIHSDEPYILSGLDTLNPILTIGDKLKLVGEYEETVGTCLIFSEKGRGPLGHEEAEANIFEGSSIDSNHAPSKQIKPVTALQKILKFRLLSEADGHDLTKKPSDPLQQGANVSNENRG